MINQEDNCRIRIVYLVLFLTIFPLLQTLIIMLFCFVFTFVFVSCVLPGREYGSGVVGQHSSGFLNLLRLIFAQTGCALCSNVTCIYMYLSLYLQSCSFLSAVLLVFTCICPCICKVEACYMQCYLYLHVFVLVFAELKLAQSLQCSEQLF